MAEILMIIAGIVIGLVGRVLAPGDKKRTPRWLTILCGIGGVFVGAYGYRSVAYQRHSGFIGSVGIQWAIALAVGALFVVIALVLTGLRRPGHPTEKPDQVAESSAAVAAKPTVFLSYRRADAQALAGRIADHLEQRFPGATVFYDVDSIAPGVNFRSTISGALQQSHVLLAVIDRHWADWTASGRRRLDEPGDFVALELRTAAQLGIPIIPVIDPYATMPSAAALPADLAWFADQQALHLHQNIGFDYEMVRLDDRLVNLLPAPAPAPAPASASKSVAPVRGEPGAPVGWRVTKTILGLVAIIVLVIIILQLT